MKNLFEVFESLHERQWSGEVQITASEGFVSIVITKGRLFYAHRPIDRANEKYSQISWIKALADTELGDLHTWQSYVRSLIASNSTRSDELIKFLNVERLELFFRSFFWSNVEVFPKEYEIDTNDYPELHFYRTVDIRKLLKEAEIRLKEWPSIQSKIGSSKRYFVSRVISSDTTGSISRPGDEIDRALSQFEETAGQTGGFKSGIYSEEEMEILRLCDGSHSVQDLIRECRDGEYLTLRRVIDLWQRGLIIPKDDEISFSVREEADRSNWKREILGVTVASLLLSFIFVGSALLNFESQPKTVPNALVQALEIHRALYGRYPVTLIELKESGLLSESIEGQGYAYKLLNLQHYELKRD